MYQIPLIEICKELGLSYTKHGYGGNYKVNHFGGLIVKGSFFYQHSTGAKGGPIQFIMLVEGCSYTEAVRVLKQLRYVSSDITNTIKIQMPEKKECSIRAAWNLDSEIIHYLLNRHIAANVINKEIEHNRIKGIYVNNYLHVAFLCYDIVDLVTVKGAIIRGVTNAFKGMLKDSDGSYGYYIPSNNKRNLYVFEAPIDLLSYITLFGYDDMVSYIAMGGVKLKVIDRLMQQYNYRYITCCTDNDTAGELFFNQLQNTYTHLLIRRKRPILKDWNEDLINDNI